MKLNRIIAISSLALVMTGTSCSDDFLDRKPYGKVTSEDLGFGEDILYSANVFKAYGHMREYSVAAMPFVAITSIASDDADKGSTPTDGPDQAQIDNFRFNADNGIISSWYKGNYEGITACNLALNTLDSIQVGDESVELLKAEARFLRGVYYFNLVRSFGGLSIVDRQLEQTEQTPPRSDIDATYAFIQKDVEYAMGILPPKSVQPISSMGRATRDAAKAFLAKTYLYQKNWQQAYNLTKEIIESGEYNLKTPYDKIFTEDGENSSESVFEVQCEHNIYYGREIGSQYAQVQGIRGSLDYGWGFNTPSKALYEAYEAGDPRKAATIMERGATLEDGVKIPSGAPNAYYNKKVYPWLVEQTKPNRNFNSYWYFGAWINIRLMRYADVVLMNAEAANEIGGEEMIDEALEKLEMVRNRARGGNPDILPKVTTRNQAELRDKIRFERRIELAMEHERYFDIVRWGIAGDVLGAKWIPGKHELFPIPQEQIDLSNHILTQNPGY